MFNVKKSNNNNKILCSPQSKALYPFLPEYLVQATTHEVDIIQIEMLELIQFGELGKDLCKTAGFHLLVPRQMHRYIDFLENESLEVLHLAQARG